MTMINSVDQALRTCGRGPLTKVFGDEGICTDVQLQVDELATLRRLTTESWLAVLRRVAPDKAKEFDARGIENYHRIAHLVDHARIWTTEARTYSAEAVEIIRSFSLFRFFDRECPGYRICSEMPPYGDLGRARMNWRLVRPGAGSDLGPIHADYWFEAVMPDWSGYSVDTIKVKIWIPIFMESGLTGFAYSPGSHLAELPFKRKQLPDGAVKPELEESDLRAPLQTASTPCGAAVLFNYNLVHRGANSDKAVYTRVSMETTLDVPRRQLERICGDLSAFY